MKAILMLVGLIVIVGLGLGLYRGWFNVSSDKDPGNSSITLSVDSDKMAADKTRVVDAAQDVSHDDVDKTAPTPQ